MLNNVVLELLNSINFLGYKSYVVGGYARDLIWGISNDDIDIVTNAPVDILLDCFKDFNPVKLRFNTIKFKYQGLSIDIAQMRYETYENNKIRVEYTNDLYKDYLRRDFTFNGIYIDSNGNYVNFDSSIDDCKNKHLKFIGNPNNKCREDPTRIFRAIYLILKYNLNSYEELFTVKLTNNDFINCDMYALNKIIYKILKLNKNKDFIDLLNKCNIYKYIFNNVSDKYNLEPLEFLNEYGYVYIDSIHGLK